MIFTYSNIFQANVLLQKLSSESELSDKDRSLVHLHIGNHMKDLGQLDDAVQV